MKLDVEVFVTRLSGKNHSNDEVIEALSEELEGSTFYTTFDAAYEINEVRKRGAK